MRGLMKRASVIATAVVVVAAGFSLRPRASAENRGPQTSPEPQPTLRIPVAPLGYTPPSAFYLTYRLSSASLAFFDDDCLLFTFRVGGLLRRLPGDRDDDDDQQIRAVVLDAHTGKIIRQTEWRMHDRGQYLWPLTDGKFLLRERNALYLTDEKLVLDPYLSFDTTLRGIEVAPDRSRLIVERDDPPKLALSSGGQDTGRDRNPVKIEIMAAGSRQALVLQEAQSAVHVPLTGDGILDVLDGREVGSWAIRDVPFQGSPRILADVKSNCQPTVQSLSASVALVMGCYQGDDDRPVVALSTTTGRELWRMRWENKYVWGWFTSAENGSRFAYESVEVARPVGIFDELDEDDISAQMVGVYDTASGKLVLVRDATPVLTAGQNVALSPDGKRFAVLRHGAVEVYDLPPVSLPPAADSSQIEAKKK